MKPIVLLDLYATLCENPEQVGKPWQPNIAVERYRLWLVDLIRQHHVILITWRHPVYREATLANIHEHTGWQPNEDYFNGQGLRAHAFKPQVLERFVFPSHGADRQLYLGLESNSQTREAYSRMGVYSLPVPKVGAWTELPLVQPVAVPDASGKPPMLF